MTETEISGAELRERRKALGLTMVELGKAIGVHWNTIARWERGVLKIERPTMLILALQGLKAKEGRKRKPKPPAP